MTAESYVYELEVATKMDTLNGGGRFVVNDRVTERTDSVWRAIDSMVRRHVAQLNARPLEPRYLLGLAHLELQLGHDATAEQHLETWLKTPGLTAADSITAFGMMVHAFLAREVTTARLAAARRYVSRIEAFHTPDGEGALFGVRLQMMGAYDGRGQSDSAAAWGLKAYGLLNSNMPYESRAGRLTDAMPLSTLARNLAGSPNGVKRLDSLLTVLKRLAVLQPAEVAKDTMLRVLQQ